MRLLTDEVGNEATLKTSLGTLVRVLDAVNWHAISKGNLDAWLYFYEDFLEVYDNTLRKLTGSYYTPPEVVGPAYLNLLGRAADAAGIANWTTAMLGGLTDQKLEAGFVASDEFYANAGGNDTAWVDAVAYRAEPRIARITRMAQTRKARRRATATLPVFV